MIVPRSLKTKRNKQFQAWPNFVVFLKSYFVSVWYLPFFDELRILSESCWLRQKTEHRFVTIYHRPPHKFLKHIRFNTPLIHLMYLIVWRVLLLKNYFFVHK
jgi:hypothetical protein